LLGWVSSAAEPGADGGCGAEQARSIRRIEAGDEDRGSALEAERNEI
jgi:hypothetical protein